MLAGALSLTPDRARASAATGHPGCLDRARIVAGAAARSTRSRPRPSTRRSPQRALGRHGRRPPASSASCWTSTCSPTRTAGRARRSRAGRRRRHPSPASRASRTRAAPARPDRGSCIAPDRVVTNAHVVAGVDTPDRRTARSAGARGTHRVLRPDRRPRCHRRRRPRRARAPGRRRRSPPGTAAAVQGYPYGGPFTMVNAEVLSVGHGAVPDIYGEIAARCARSTRSAATCSPATPAARCSPTTARSPARVRAGRDATRPRLRDDDRPSSSRCSPARRAGPSAVSIGSLHATDRSRRARTLCWSASQYRPTTRTGEPRQHAAEHRRSKPPRQSLRSRVPPGLGRSGKRSLEDPPTVKVPASAHRDRMPRRNSQAHDRGGVHRRRSGVCPHETGRTHDRPPHAPRESAPQPSTRLARAPRGARSLVHRLRRLGDARPLQLRPRRAPRRPHGRRPVRHLAHGRVLRRRATAPATSSTTRSPAASRRSRWARRSTRWCSTRTAGSSTTSSSTA